MSNFITERLAICNSCEYNMENICVLCACDLSYKTTQEEEFCPLHEPKWGKRSQVVIPKPEIASTPAQVPTLQSTAPPQGAVCVPCQSKTR